MRYYLLLLMCLILDTNADAQSRLYRIWTESRKDIEAMQLTCRVKGRRGKKYLDIREWRGRRGPSTNEDDYRAIMDSLTNRGFIFDPKNDTLFIVFTVEMPKIVEVRAYSKQSYIDYGYDYRDKTFYTDEYVGATTKLRAIDSLLINNKIDVLEKIVLERGIVYDTFLQTTYLIIIHDGKIIFPVKSWVYDYM